MVELLHVHCVNTNSRALAWPKPSHNLTCVTRRPQHRASSQVGSKSWRHPLAPKHPTFQCHIPASNPRIAAQTDNAQVALAESEESPGTTARCETPPTLPDWERIAWLDRGTCHWSCNVPADRTCVPAAGARDISTVSTPDLPVIVECLLPFMREFGATTSLGRSSWPSVPLVSRHELGLPDAEAEAHWPSVTPHGTNEQAAAMATTTRVRQETTQHKNDRATTGRCESIANRVTTREAACLGQTFTKESRSGSCRPATGRDHREASDACKVCEACGRTVAALANKCC